MTTKLGGQLEPFADVSKGYRLAKPLGWNRYDGTSGEYTVKMVDLVDPTTLILLTNSPVKSDTEVRVRVPQKERGDAELRYTGPGRTVHGTPPPSKGSFATVLCSLWGSIRNQSPGKGSGFLFFCIVGVEAEQGVEEFQPPPR